MLRHLTFALLCLSATATAAADPRVDMTVIDREHNYPLNEYRHRGDTWIAGTPGHRYAVRLSNRSPERVLVVLSVDGVNAVTGANAHPSQAGYVLEPWQSTEVNGWRKSMRSVAQFIFTDLPDSYAARTGRPDNVGVIGIAIFEEARDGWRDRPLLQSHHDESDAQAASAPAPSARTQSSTADASTQELGTGHGEREWSPVSNARFARSSRQPVEVLELRYDDTNALIARGVISRPRRHRGDDTPRAFPNGFVADPPPNRW